MLYVRSVDDERPLRCVALVIATAAVHTASTAPTHSELRAINQPLCRATSQPLSPLGVRIGERSTADIIAGATDVYSMSAASSTFASSGPAGAAQAAPTSPAAASAALLLSRQAHVPSFAELFDVLSTAVSTLPASLPPAERVSSSLAALFPSLLSPFSSFPPYSASAVPSSARSAGGLHADWKALLVSFASSSDLDIDAAAVILVSQLRSFAAQSASGHSLHAPSADSLTAAYHCERSALLGCLACLFRIQLDPTHPYHSAAAATASQWVKEGGEANLLATLRSHCTRADWGQAADQRMREQSLMLQVLFLLYYDLDADYSQLSASSLPQRVNELLQLLADTALFSRQASYLQLSEDGRQQVLWLSVLSTLLVLEVLMVGRLRVILDHPVFDLLEEARLDEWGDWPADQRDRRRQEVNELMTDAQKELETHIFSDDTFLAQVDSTLFSPVSPLAQPLIQLAWTVLLALLVEYQEDLSSLQSLYALSLSSPPSASPVLTRDHLLIRLSTALLGPVSPFEAMTQQLRALIGHRSLLRPDEGDADASGYKEVMHELLNALCSSSLYGVLESVRPELCRMFALVMEGDNDLSYRFWEQDQQAALDKPLVNDAINVFPARLTLLPMLAALSGHTVEGRERVREDGLRDEDAATAEDGSSVARDAAVCASQGFRTLLSLQTYTAPAEPSDYYSKSATAGGWTLTTTQRTVTADGVVLPAGVYGRLVHGDLVQWRVQWSGWHMLLNRLDRRITQRCTAGDADWDEVNVIVSLIAKLVSNHSELFRELQLHALTAVAEPLDITMLTLRVLLLLPSAESWVPRKAESVLLDVLSASVAVLTASLQIDLIHFTRVFTATLSGSSLSAILSDSSTDTPSSASQSCAAFLHLVQTVHSNIERVHGSYPLTSFLCHLTHAWIPHYQLSLLHLSRPPSVRAFPIAVSAPSSSSTFSSFAALDVRLLLSSISTSVLPSSLHWRYQQPNDRLRLMSAAMKPILISVGHALSVAAQQADGAAVSVTSLRVQLASWLTERGGCDGLLAALVEAATCMSALLAARKVAEAALMEDVAVQALYVVNHLLKMEKANVVDADSTPSARLYGGFHAAIVQQVTVQHRSSVGQLLAVFTAASVQPHCCLQAVVLLLTPAFAVDVHKTALRTLILAATPLTRNSSPNLSGLLSPVLDVLRTSLYQLAHPRSPPEIHELVYQFMAVVLSTDGALAELLLINEQSEAGTTERGMSATFSPITRSLVAPLQQSVATWHASQPALLSSVFQLLAALWSNPTAALQTALIRPLSEEFDVWQHVRDVLEQPVPSASSDEQPRMAEVKYAGAADEDDKTASADTERREADVESVQVSPSAIRFGHQLSARSYALQLLAMECYQGGKLPESVSSYFSLVDSVALLSSCTQCEDDTRLRTQCMAWAEQLRIGLSAISNPQLSISGEEDTGRYLLEVAHRLLFDDLIAAARQETFVVARAASPSPLAYVSHQPATAQPTSTGGYSLAVVGQPSVESHRDAMMCFLAALSRLNAIDHITARQTLLARSYHSFMQAALNKQPDSLLPPTSASPWFLLQALTTSLSTARSHSHSAAMRAVQVEVAGLLSSLLHYFLSSSSLRSKQLMSSIVAASAAPDSTSYEQLRLSHSSLCGLLESVVDCMMTTVRTALPMSAEHSLRSSVREVFLHCASQERPLMGRWVELLGYDNDDDKEHHQQQQTPSEEDSAEDALALFESLLLSACLLLRYSSHLQSVYSILRSRPASSRPVPNRPLDLSAAPSRSARTITFTSPQPPPSASKKSGSQLSPVVEGGDEDVESGSAVLDGMYGALGGITQCLMLVGAASVSHTLLCRSSAALASTALQCINKSARHNDQSRCWQSAASTDLIQSSSTHSSADERLIVSVRCLDHWTLSPLIQRFMTLPVSAASEAQSILRFFLAVAATVVGAAALQRHSLVLHLCQHAVFNPPAAFPSVNPSPVYPSQMPSFSPYLTSGERDPWHGVWCSTVSLVYSLLQSASVSGPSPSLLSSLQFLLVYRPRLQFVLQRRQQRSLSIGHLQEVDAVVRYMSLTGRMLAIRQPASAEEDELLAEVRAMLSSLTDEYVRLLMDSRLLEARSLPVSSEERAMAADDDKEPASFERTDKSDKHEAGESKDERRGEEKLPEKKLWRPLGSASKKGTSAVSGSSPASASNAFSSPLRSPSKSASAASPPLFRRVSGSGSVMEDSAERASGRKRPAILTQPPALQAVSFLLRSPMVAGMRYGSGGGDVGAGSIFDSWSSEAASSGIDQRSFAFFVHAIEFAVCRILRDCFALLRVLSAVNVSRPASRSLFNYRTKVFDAQPLLGPAPPRYEDDFADMDSREGASDDGEYDDLIDTEEQFDTLTAAGELRRDAQRASATRSLLASSPFLPSLSYRPALSVLIDFSRYCLHLLNRLTAISPLLHHEAARQRVQAQLASLATPSQYTNGTPALPSLTALLSLLNALLESSLLILVEQAQRHIGRLTALFSQFNQYAVKYRQQMRQQVQQQQQQYANRLSLPFAAFPAPQPAAPSIPVHPAALAATRLHVALDGYRDRLLLLADELTRYVSARSGVQLERRRSSVHSPLSPKSGGGGGGGGGLGAGGSGGSGGSAASWSAATAVEGAVGSAPNQLAWRIRERMYEMVAELDGHDREWLSSQ